MDVQRLLPKLRSGNVSQISFGFVVREKFAEDRTTTPVRILREGRAFDVPPVTFPPSQAPTGGLTLRAAYQRRKGAARDSGVSAPVVFRVSGTPLVSSSG